jgi:hypothetical protein
MFAASGLLAGIAMQFRPNLLLFPPLLALVYLVVGSRSGRKMREAGSYLAVVALALLPWVIRNYRLTGEFLPTSTHGGYQLWLGTLESWPYLERRPDNPRKVFDAPSFDYTSIESRPLEVTALASDCGPTPQLVYWTDRDRTERAIAARSLGKRRVLYELPAQQSPTALYYRFVAPANSGVRLPDRPSTFFISTDHLGDLDRHGDFADAFDVIRLLRHQAWNEPLPDAEMWDLTNDGRVDEQDTRALIDRLIKSVEPRWTGAIVSIEPAADAVAVRLSDGSVMSVPRVFSGRITDISVSGGLAGTLVYAHRSMAALREGDTSVAPCGDVGDIAVNDAFYRREPHWMRRYTALALDNISRNPSGFAVASLYRIGRLFIIRGSSDVGRAQQFAASQLIYGSGLILSIAVFALFLVGMWIAWRRRSAVLWLLLPVVYVPLTICFVLTNMRYSITVQPLIFVFVAIALVGIVSPTSRARQP